MKYLASLKVLLSFKNRSFVAGIIVSLAVVFVGYGLIKNIKTDKQSASAEQVGASPESGAKSRIAELYDTLKAKNLGSDTDMTGLDTLTDDWGPKWNRIKSSALKSQPTGTAPVAGTVKSVQRGVASISSDGSVTISLSPINKDKSVVSLQGGCGRHMEGGKFPTGNLLLPSVDNLTNTALKVYCSGYDHDKRYQFSWQVVEYY